MHKTSFVYLHPNLASICVWFPWPTRDHRAHAIQFWNAARARAPPREKGRHRRRIFLLLLHYQYCYSNVDPGRNYVRNVLYRYIHITCVYVKVQMPILYRYTGYTLRLYFVIYSIWCVHLHLTYYTDNRCVALYTYIGIITRCYAA